MDKEFIRIREAAALLSVTPLTLRNWDRRGLLAAYRHPVNNYRLYRTADIQELLSRYQRPTAVPTATTFSDEATSESESAPHVVAAEPPPPLVQRLAVTFEDEV